MTVDDVPLSIAVGGYIACVPQLDVVILFSSQVAVYVIKHLRLWHFAASSLGSIFAVLNLGCKS